MRRERPAVEACRRVLAALALGTAFAAVPAAAADGKSAPTARPVLDPHYGDGLFHFFQDRAFASLSSLMVSQHFERLPNHADEAEVLRGGLLLAYGMHHEAGRIFAQLIERGAAPAVRDRAWFFLAKIRWQRGFTAEAEAALGRIEQPLKGELEDERGLLHAQVLMARGDYAAAGTLLDRLAASPTAGPYARFNLGVALIRAGDTARGSALLDALGRAPAADEELRSLRDRANVALGFAALQDERPQPARDHLQRVRLAGPQASKALLGFGWAAASLEQHELALVPWAELATRDPSDAAVLEGRIALPYAYAELGASNQALARYQDALAAFEREAAHLDESIAAIRAGQLEAGLLERNPGEEMGWLRGIRALPAMPHAGHLGPVLAEHAFQEAFKNYRDLRFLADTLRRWQETLGVYGDMLDNRRQAFERRLPQVRAEAESAGTGRAALQRRRDALAAELAEAERAADGAAFADAAERALHSRLADVQATLRAAGDDPALADARERARRVAAALSWRLAQSHAPRAWTAKKALAATDAQLAQATLRDAALDAAQRDEPARHAAFEARIRGLAPRVDALLPQVARLADEQRLALQDIAVAALAQQKDRLAVYATQARFAIAQLHDRASVAGTGTTEASDVAR